MKYRLILEADNPNESVDFLALIEVETEKPEPKLQSKLKTVLTQQFQSVLKDFNKQSAALSRSQARSGRPPKPVCITAVEEPETAPAGIKEGAVITSSMELSALLGYDYNMVLQALSKAFKDKQELQAKLRGVTFCYVENLPTARE